MSKHVRGVLVLAAILVSLFGLGYVSIQLSRWLYGVPSLERRIEDLEAYTYKAVTEDRGETLPEPRFKVD